MKHKIMNNRPMLFAFFAICIGILLGTALHNIAVYICFAVLTVGAIAVMSKRYGLSAYIAVLLIGIVLAWQGYISYPQLECECNAVGEVGVKTKNGIVLENATVYTEYGTYEATRVFVYTGLVYETGDILSVTGKCTPYGREKENFGDTSTVLSAVADNLSYSVSSATVTKIGHNEGIRTALCRLKNKISDTVYSVCEDEECAAVLLAMLIGDKTAVSSETYSLFMSTGTSHLLAVSGLHTAILLSVVGAFFGFFKKKILNLISVSAFLIFYTVLTGMSPSVIRASIMAFALALARARGDRYDLLNTLGTAGTFILLVNPYRLYDISFQLSFTAVFGICAVQGLRMREDIKRITAPLMITLGATVATAPIILYRFGTFSSVAFIGNLILLPYATAALAILFVFTVIALIFPSAAIIIKLPYWMMLAAMNALKLISDAPVITFACIGAAFVIIALLLVLFYSRFVLVGSKIKALTALCLTVALSFNILYNTVRDNNTVSLTVISATVPSVHIRYGENDYIVNYCSDNKTQTDSYIESTVGSVDGYIFSEIETDNQVLECEVLGGTLTDRDLTAANIGCGLLIEYNGYKLLIQNGSTPHGKYDVAIGTEANAAADISVTRDSLNPLSPTTYRTQSVGAVRITVGKRIKITTV